MQISTQSLRVRQRQAKPAAHRKIEQNVLVLLDACESLCSSRFVCTVCGGGSGSCEKIVDFSEMSRQMPTATWRDVDDSLECGKGDGGNWNSHGRSDWRQFLNEARNVEMCHVSDTEVMQRRRMLLQLTASVQPYTGQRQR